MDFDGLMTILVLIGFMVVIDVIIRKSVEKPKAKPDRCPPHAWKWTDEKPGERSFLQCQNPLCRKIFGVDPFNPSHGSRE